MESLDRIDRDILALLQTEGRLTGAEVGRRVGLSQPAASARIQRLEKNGVITGYRADVDPAALGLNIHAIIRLRTTHAQLSRALDLASKIPEVVSTLRVTGRTASSSTSIARKQDDSKKSSTHLPATALPPRHSCSAPTPEAADQRHLNNVVTRPDVLQKGVGCLQQGAGRVELAQAADSDLGCCARRTVAPWLGLDSSTKKRLCGLPAISSGPWATTAPPSTT